jgi:hypothetical protein
MALEPALGVFVRFAKASSLYYVISINLFILPSDSERGSYVCVSLGNIISLYHWLSSSSPFYSHLCFYYIIWLAYGT